MNLKDVMITDELNNEFKNLTCNQIKLVLASLLNDDLARTKTILFHKSNKRFNEAIDQILYLKPKLDIVKKIKNTKLDKANKKQFQENLAQLKKYLKSYTYYKIPPEIIKNIISSKISKTQLLFILKFYSILRMTFHRSYTYNINDFIKSIFGDISRKEMVIKRQILKKMSNKEVTNGNIKVTISNKEVTISNILVTKKSTTIIK